LKKLYINLNKSKTFLSNRTFKEEKCFEAFTMAQDNRELFVSIKEVEKLSKEVAKKLVKVVN